MKNKFGGRCLHCGEWVEPLAGKYTCETVLQELNCKRLTNTTYWSKS